MNAGLVVAGLILANWAGVLGLGLAGANPGAGHWAADLAWMALTTWLYTGLFITAHEAMHRLVAPDHPRLNRAVGQLCLWLYAGLSYERLLRGHIGHHAAPSTEDDPDYHPGRAGVVGWYVRFMRAYLSLTPIVVVAVSFQLVLWAGVPVERALAMWIAPQVISSFQLFFFGTWLPHRPGVPFAHGTRARSSDFPVWLSLLSCYHFGYHREHHLAPWVPWWQLPALRHLDVAGRAGVVQKPHEGRHGVRSRS